MKLRLEGPIPWQRCPICEGHGHVSGGFYAALPGYPGLSTNVAEKCRQCDGKGMIPMLAAAREGGEVTRRDLPFQPWGRKAIAEGRKTLTSRSSGLAAVNRKPDEWTYGGENIHGEHIFYNSDDNKGDLLIRCPWQVGVDYSGVTVTGIAVKRVQDMTTDELVAEGVDDMREYLSGVKPDALDIAEWGDMESVFMLGWDSIHRRVNNRYERNPWTWRLSIKPTEQPQ